MKEFIVFSGLIAVLCLLSNSQCQSVENRRNGDGVASMITSYSVDSIDDNNRDNTGSADVSQTAGPEVVRIGVWRPRDSSSRGIHDNAQPSEDNDRRHIRPYRRRRPQRTNGVNGDTSRRHPNGRENSNVRHRADALRRQYGTRRLVASGSHSVSPGNGGQNPVIDPFVALQNGHNDQNRQNGRIRQNPFQDRRTAYDFLSNGGGSNRFGVRNESRRERREENARIAAVMCGVFGKQFVPSAIGGRCV